MVEILCSVFTQSVTVVGWGLSLRLMSPALGCLFCDEMMYWIHGTKSVLVCGGTMRYHVGWVHDCDLIMCYCFYE